MKRDGFNTRGKFGEHTESFIVKDVAGHRHLTATKTGVRAAWNWIPILPMQTLGDFSGPCFRCFVARLKLLEPGYTARTISPRIKRSCRRRLDVTVLERIPIIPRQDRKAARPVGQKSPLNRH